MTTLILADPQPLILYAVRSLVQEVSDFQIAAECTNGEDTLQAVAEHQADLLVMNVALQHPGAFAVLEELLERNSVTHSILLFDHISGHYVLEAMRWRVRGMVPLDKALTMLVPCLQKVQSGGEWLELDSVRNAFDHVLHTGKLKEPLNERLTHREMEFVHLVAAGQSNKQMARELNSTEGAIKANLHRIYNKLEIRGRVELVRLMNELEHF